MCYTHNKHNIRLYYRVVLLAETNLFTHYIHIIDLYVFHPDGFVGDKSMLHTVNSAYQGEGVFFNGLPCAFIFPPCISLDFI